MKYRCHTCGHESKAWAPMQRHVDEQHYPGGRIEFLFTLTKGNVR